METKIKEFYHHHKKKLLDLTHRLDEVLAEDGWGERIAKIRKNVRDEKFRFVVLGQFKRGKSTFINALLRAKVLPTDVIPVTAVITEIRYGADAAAKVFFAEDAPREIPVPELSRFISESENPSNQKGVDKVELTYPAEILRDGLILVDTPGVGSIHEHNTRLTREYIPNVDAAVFLFSADPPLTELEQEFLKVIYPVVPRIFFVLNKKDYLEPDALERVLAFNSKVLSEISGKTPEIEPVSALQGLKVRTGAGNEEPDHSGLPELEEKLNRFLVGQRGKYFLLSNVERLISLGNEWKNLMELDRQARALSVEELTNNLEQFNRFMDEIKRRSEHISFLLNGIQQRFLEEYDRLSGEFALKTVPEIVAQTHAFLESRSELGKARLAEEAERFINNEIIDTFEPFRLRTEKQFKEKYREEISRLNHDVEKILTEVYRYSEDLFKISGLADLSREAWKYENQFYYRVWEVETSLDMLQEGAAGLLPRPLFLRRQKQQARKSVRQKMERQCGRLRAELLTGLQENNRQFIFEFKQVLEQIENGISRLIRDNLKKKEKGQQELEADRQKAERELAQVQQILKEADEIKLFWQKESLVAQ